jgi:hypothetical protein
MGRESFAARVNTSVAVLGTTVLCFALVDGRRLTVKPDTSCGPNLGKQPRKLQGHVSEGF